MINFIRKLFKQKKSIEEHDVPYESISPSNKYKNLLRVIPNRLTSSGEIVIPKHFVNEGDRVEVFIKPNKGYTFTHVTIKQMTMMGRFIDYTLDITDDVGKIVFTMPNVDVVVSTKFIEK